MEDKVSNALWMQWVLLATAIATFGSFSWGIRSFFTAPNGVQPGMRRIQQWGSIGALLQVAFLAMGHVGFAEIALGFYFAAFLLFWAAVLANRARPLSLAHSTDVPLHLNMAGPYRWVRHPFYASYMLAWLAGVLATGQWWLLVHAAYMYSLYVGAAREEELKFMRSPLGLQYAAYRQRTGAFFPLVIGYC